ncbi:hypothetical protein Q8A67_008077 [Cirrhinus molitorella]|uniref:Uncharacterized protein n=1 Tax=Cirrhinus molitorella TaxID=172907 RepID=A0AA88Q3C8_9TELE|nr:hypothetical protein Q8A67_008077 [Cirrhinus molitorella]
MRSRLFRLYAPIRPLRHQTEERIIGIKVDLVSKPDCLNISHIKYNCRLLACTGQQLFPKCCNLFWFSLESVQWAWPCLYLISTLTPCLLGKAVGLNILLHMRVASLVSESGNTVVHTLVDSS